MKSKDSGFPEWNAHRDYTIGEVVEFEGKLFACIVRLTSNASPTDAPMLWQRVGQSLPR